MCRSDIWSILLFCNVLFSSLCSISSKRIIHFFLNISLIRSKISIVGFPTKSSSHPFASVYNYVWYCNIGAAKFGWWAVFILRAEILLLYHSSSADIPEIQRFLDKLYRIRMRNFTLVLDRKLINIDINLNPFIRHIEVAFVIIITLPKIFIFAKFDIWLI